jgi:Tol biopolymer transport system component
MRPDGSGQHVIADGSHDETEPTWSPDSDRLAFLRGDEVWVIDADGSDERFVAERAHGTPHWSSDGDTIVFPRGPSMYVVPADGGEACRIEPDDPSAGHDLSGPYRLQDGRIFFTAHADHVWTMGPDGSNAERVGLFEEGVGPVEPEPCGG